MTRHLSYQEISEHLMGTGSPEADSHVRVCVTCGAEIERREIVLDVFRASIYHWADRQRATAIETEPTLLLTPESPNGQKRFAGVLSVLIHCAAVAVLFIVGSMNSV